jgi:hypothetical protein
MDTYGLLSLMVIRPLRRNGLANQFCLWDSSGPRLWKYAPVEKVRSLESAWLNEVWMAWTSRIRVDWRSVMTSGTAPKCSNNIINRQFKNMGFRRDEDHEVDWTSKLRLSRPSNSAKFGGYCTAANASHRWRQILAVIYDLQFSRYP